MESKRKRSRSYPGYNLEDCIHWIGKIRSELGSGPYDRIILAKALGSTGLTGASTRKIGALVHFGLLRRDTSGYHVSVLSESIVKPVNDAEKSEALLESLLRPHLYRDLLNRFSEDGRIPVRLSNILIRDHGIEDVAAEDAVRVFILSARYAGILDDDGRIICSRLEDRDTPARDESRHQTPHLPTEARPSEPATSTNPLATDQRFDFALTGGRSAQLCVPRDLTPSDMRLVEKQIELLALQVDIMVGVDQ